MPGSRRGRLTLKERCQSNESRGVLQHDLPVRLYRPVQVAGTRFYHTVKSSRRACAAFVQGQSIPCLQIAQVLQSLRLTSHVLAKSLMPYQQNQTR